MYFVVNIEHQVIMGTTDIIYSSFTNQFVECTEDQAARYEQLQSALPPDTYFELKDLIKPSTTAIDHPQVTATPATLAAVKSLFRK